MTREEIQKLYNQIAKRADARTRLTLDQDEIQDLFIDKDNRIYLCNHLTPYTTDNVKLIKYRLIYDENDPMIGNAVMISFDNGDAIRIDNIGVDGFINYQYYDVRGLFHQYSTLITDCREPTRYITWYNVMKQLQICFDKADIVGFDLQQDEYSYGDIFFDNDILFISMSVETPYKLNDIKSIMYYLPSKKKAVKSNESPYVRIRFSNGDNLQLEDGGKYKAYVKNGDEFFCVEGVKAIAETYSKIIRET